MGGPAARLVSEHFDTRCLQVMVAPDPKTQVFAAFNARPVGFGGPAAEAAEAAGPADGAVGVKVSEAPFGMAVALDTTHSGLAASATAASGGLTAFALGRAGLGRAVTEPSASVGLAFASAHVDAVVSTDVVAAGTAARAVHGAVVGRIEGPEHGLHLGADLSSAERHPCTVHSVAASYCGLSHQPFSGRPSRYQLGVAIEDNARRMVASFFQHRPVRAGGGSGRPFWRAVNYGGQFTHTADMGDERGAARTELAVAAAYQVTERSMVKARASTAGGVELFGSAWGTDLHETMPGLSVGLAVGLGMAGVSKLGWSVTWGHIDDWAAGSAW